MDVIEYLLLLLVFFVGILGGGSVVLYWTYRRARSKGYRPPAAALILLLGVSAGIGTTVALHPQNTTNAALFFWRFFWVPMLLSAAGLVLLALILPRRTARVFGERKARFPFRGLGRLFQILAIAVVVLIGIACLLGGASFSTFVQSTTLALTLWGGAIYLLQQAKAQHLPSFEDVFQADPRPPVLYLRAFNQESQFFIMGAKEQYGRWAKSFHAAIARDDQKIGLTVEEYLAQDLNESIGPFVALGSPEDYLAPPGALRLYAKDDEWKTRFHELARRAACIIVEVNKSDNLRWEFEHLRREGLQEKLFVLTRPSKEGSGFQWAFWGMLWRVKGIRTMMWPEFTTDLKKLGYAIKFADPGAGAVLGFDALGEAFVLTTEGNWPQDFVGPIEAWIAERKKIGRWVCSKCAKCGREIYACQSESAPLCYDCRAGAKPAKRAWRRMRELAWGLVLVAGAFALKVIVVMIFPGQWVDRWSGWLFIALVLLLVLVATLLSTRKKSRSES